MAGYGDRLDESDEDYIAAVNTQPGPCLCVFAVLLAMHGALECVTLQSHAFLLNFVTLL